VVKALDVQLTVMSSNPCNMAIFFDFSRWRPPPSWIFIFLIFNGGNGQECRTTSLCHMSNFIEIAQTAVEISQFLDFSKWQLPLCWIFKFLNF